MIGKRIAGGLLVVVALLALAACSGSSDSAGSPASAQPSHTTAPSEETGGVPEETVTPLLEQALPDVKDRTFTSAVVEFPPGSSSSPHRHGNALVYAYVLEGTIDSRLDDGPVTTYHKGENWIEQPGTHHVRTENPSDTEPAKLLVVFVSHTGDDLTVYDETS